MRSIRHTALPPGLCAKRCEDVIEITSNVPTSSKKKLRTKGEKQQEIARLDPSDEGGGEDARIRDRRPLRDQIKALEEK